MKNNLAIIRRYLLLILSQLVIFYVAIINVFPKGYIFVLGDVTQYFNLGSILKNFNYVWESSLTGFGNFLTLYPYRLYYLVVYFLKSVLSLTSSQQSSVYYLIFLLGSFWSFYLSSTWLYRKKDNLNLKVLLSLVYTFNIYTLYNFIYSWGFSPFLILYILIPPTFVLIFRFLSGSKMSWKTLAALGVIFFLSNISSGNFAFFVAFSIFLLLISALLLVKFGKFRRVLALFVTLLLATAWSVLPQITNLLSQARDFTAGQSYFNLSSWIVWQASKFPDVFFFLFDFNQFYVKLPLISLSVILFVLFLVSLIKGKNSLFRMLMLVLLIVDIFLINKGKGIISTDALLSIFNNPLLGSLRSFDKTAVFLPFFVLSIIADYFLSSKQSKRTSIALLLFFIVMSISVSPFFFGQIQKKISTQLDTGKDYLTSEYSGLVKIPSLYFEVANKTNSDLYDSKIFGLPYSVLNSVGWVNYPAWKVRGQDPTTQLFDHPVIEMNSAGSFGNWNFGQAWNGNSNSSWILSFAGLLNTDRILYHKDAADKFISQTSYKIEQLINSNDLELISSNSLFDLLKVSEKYFLPHFYTPTAVIATDKDVQALPNILLDPAFNLRSAIFFEKQNGGNLSLGKSLNGIKGLGLPVLEYKKVNPTKYKIQVHGASGVFPLIFSESYHNGWRVYLADNSAPESKEKLLDIAKNNYLRDEKNPRQASQADLINLINHGLISDLATSEKSETNYLSWNDEGQETQIQVSSKLAFISKNFKDTIQNDNLKSGSISDTWFKKPVDNNRNHLKVNGYANSWILDTGNICSSGKCIPNQDGTVDFALTVEFWPQRLYHLGLTISSVTVLSCLVYLSFRRRRKNA